MAIVDVVIPKMGMGTEEVTLVKWHVAEGDSVAAGAALADIESEKTTVTVEAEAAGEIVEICVAEDDDTTVSSVICRIETA